ncbi:MAG: tRNA (adenosine(37)-N6)-dimethylallyltransferase MiaA [Candidatus Delongbacteria bacterium]
MSALPSLLILTGPTAAGKTSLALGVAEELGMEIIGADSRQVYAGLEVATAAPDAAQRARVPHHLVGHMRLDEAASAGRFVREARAVLGLPADVRAGAGGRTGPLPFLLCGGSGFYLHALLQPVDPSLQADDGLRAHVLALHVAHGLEGVRRELLARDPEAEWIPPTDSQRQLRYLELCLATGEPASRVLRERRLPRPVQAFCAVLEAPVDWLDERIRVRSRQLLETGMVDELRAALAAGVPRTGHALRSVGVEEVEALLAGELDLAGCAARLTLRTRQLARRQRTWLRGLGEREPVLRLDATRPEAELREQLLRGWQAATADGGGAENGLASGETTR